jgi:exopolyphosphatase/pppGpp-phosphohydrolase
MVGVDVKLISAELEAALSFDAVASRHAGEGDWIMVDLGGNSTEVVKARGRRLREWCSLELGSGTFASSRLSDPPSAEEQAALREAASEVLRDVSFRGAEKVVLTGGSPIYLPLLFRREWMETFDRADVSEARALLQSDYAQPLAGRFQLPKARIEVLRGAVEIIEVLLDHVEQERIFLSREGIPHGMVLAYAERGEDWARLLPPPGARWGVSP